MKISVVIPSFNRSATLEWVLPSLLEQSLSRESYEILLCDAGSTDGTRELAEKLDPKGQRIRFLPGGDSGRSGARNRGVQQAQGELILFTDADIIADPRLLQGHLKRHQAHPGNAVVGCEIQVNTLDEYERYRVNPAAHARHKPTREKLPWHYFLTGNASLLRSQLLEVGSFDEDFQGYGHEDLELGYRILKKGWTIFYAPEAVDYHWHPVPFAEQCSKMRLAGRSTVRFYRKHKDIRIPLQMGMNPISLGVHAMLPKEGRMFKWIEFKAQTEPWARPIVLQHYYVSGIKEVLNGKV